MKIRSHFFPFRNGDEGKKSSKDKFSRFHLFFLSFSTVWLGEGKVGVVVYHLSCSWAHDVTSSYPSRHTSSLLCKWKKCTPFQLFQELNFGKKYYNSITDFTWFFKRKKCHNIRCKKVRPKINRQLEESNQTLLRNRQLRHKRKFFKILQKVMDSIIFLTSKSPLLWSRQLSKHHQCLEKDLLWTFCEWFFISWKRDETMRACCFQGIFVSLNDLIQGFI